MSFASNVKNELALIEAKDVKVELAAILKTAGHISIVDKQMSIIFKTDYSKIAYRVFRHIHLLYNCKPTVSICQTLKLKKNKTYIIKIDDNVSTILDDLQLLNMDNVHERIKTSEELTSFLAGCFMACGSVNDPQTSNYHLELSFTDVYFAKEVIKIIKKKRLSPKLIQRRNYYVVYLKKSQEIADFLACMNAMKNYIEYDQIRIRRDYYNSNNRVVNCDIANYIKINTAATSQLDNINLIENKIGLDILNEDLKNVANLRKQFPDSSLKEITEQYNKLTGNKISKSSINRMFEKIKEIALIYKS